MDVQNVDVQNVAVQNVVPVLPVDDLPAAVAAWQAILGVGPTFVDGDRWAQFDVAGRRIALAGTDRLSDAAGVMIKVSDLPAARERLLAAGIPCGEPRPGPHELRCLALAPGGPVTLYSPL